MQNHTKFRGIYSLGQPERGAKCFPSHIFNRCNGSIYGLLKTSLQILLSYSLIKQDFLPKELACPFSGVTLCTFAHFLKLSEQHGLIPDQYQFSLKQV